MYRSVISLVIICFLSTSCKKNSTPKPYGEFIDYGYVSSAASTGSNQMIHYKGEVFAATDDGLWKIKLDEKTWKRSGLEGKKITCIYSHPTIDGKFFAGTVSTGPSDKSFYISADAGTTWQAATNPVFETQNNKYETYYDIKVRPGFANQVFANLSGNTIAISKDGGLTWNRQNYNPDSYFGIDCIILFLENTPNEIFQGAEAPLDHAWLGKYSIDAADPVQLGSLEIIIGGSYEWENRRPNCIENFKSNPNVLYVGMEGALSKVEGSTWKYLYKGEEMPEDFPYTYIKGIWLDPGNKNHLIFGGGVNGTNTSLSLYETYDEGNTIIQIKDMLGMIDPDIIDIVATNNYPALLIRDNGNNNKLRLLLYKY